MLWKLITPTITLPTDKVDKVDKDKDKVDKMYKDRGMRWMNVEDGQRGRGRRDGQGGQGQGGQWKGGKGQGEVSSSISRTFLELRSS